MKHFISFAESLRTVISEIVKKPEQHAKWINTLSYLENCGARKIAACQHPTLVRMEVLKHAAEEFRHALYLKRQIAKVSPSQFDDYALNNILGGYVSLNYLNRLDLSVSQYLAREAGYNKRDVMEGAYTLVTYAIELRAGELYPIYDACLKEIASNVRVNSIILEEEEHLAEMQERIEKMPKGIVHMKQALFFEGMLCQKWVDSL